MFKILAFSAFIFLATVCSADRKKRNLFEQFQFSHAAAGAYDSGYPFENYFRTFKPYVVVHRPIVFPTIHFKPIIPWYQGPNVCIDEKTFDDPSSLGEAMSDEFPGQYQISGSQASEMCQGNDIKYVCIGQKSDGIGLKRYIKKYECCHGYVRPTDERLGCVELDLRSLLPTLRIIGAFEMLKIVESSGMADELHKNNYTLFCPLNSALEEFQKQLQDDIDSNSLVKLTHRKLKKKSVLHRLLRSHMSPAFLKSGDLNDGDIIQTEDPNNEIRINVYYIPEKVTTANCVPLVSEDHFARNGIIHVLEKVLPIPIKTVADIIAGDVQFSILKGMLSRAGLVQTLRNRNGTYTVFAPTDTSFPSSSLLYKNDTRCAISAMKHYIIDHVICSSALPHHAKSLNMIGELLTLTRDEHNKLYVDEVQVVVRDLVAINGVVHIIDGLLSTNQAKPMSQILKEADMHEFLELLVMTNLKSEFDSMDNVTFFIPTDEVIRDIPKKYIEFLNNNNSLRDLLIYHVADGQLELNVADQLLQSKLQNTTVRVQVHSTYPHVAPQVLVQCATVLSADNKLCGGTLHVINRLLLPPKMTTVEFLEKIDAFHTLVLLLRATGLERRLNSDVPYTLLAPTDDAFHQIGEITLFQILENLAVATDLVKMHILPGAICCSQLKADLLAGRRQTRAIDGSSLRLDRYLDGSLLIGSARVVDCDIMASNGIVHMVDTIVNHDEVLLLGGGHKGSVFI